MHDVFPYGRWRTLQVHLRQFGRALEERLGRDSHTRRDRSTQVVTFSRDGVEGRRGAEIHDTGRTAVQLENSGGGGDAVRAHLLGVLVPHMYSGLCARAD